MGVYIKGMEMPNECRNCRMSVYHGNTGKTWCTPADAILAEGYKPIPFDGRPNWCPLREVKEPHGNLVDRETIKANMIPLSFSVRNWIDEITLYTRIPVVIEAEEGD